MRDFNTWLGQMRSSINGYNYYVDFPKVYSNVDSIKIELNIMNSLIGSKNIESDFVSLLKKYPEILKCVPTLLAVRQNEIYAHDIDGSFSYDFCKINHSIDPACGSGSLLVRAIEEPPFEIAGYGQEKDSYTSCLAKTNAVLHNKAYITIKAGNTFSNPQYNKEYDSELRHFDYIVANPPFGAASAGGKRRPGLLGKNCSRELLHEVVTKAINEAFREEEAILPLLRGNIVISLEEVTSNQIAAIDEQMRSMQQELLATIN